MMDLINGFFQRVPAPVIQSGGMSFQRPRNKIICNDGFEASVQASQNHYCEPRIDDAERYVTVEIGFPSERVESWMKYIDDPDGDPTGTVYGYVPVYLVEEALIAQGGIDWDKTIEGVENESTIN